MSNIKIKRIKTWIFIVAAFGIFIPGLSGATVSQDEVDFGEVIVNASKSIELEIKNENPSPITVSCSFKDGDMGFVSNTVPTLFLPNSSKLISITFAPKKAGRFSDVLLVNYSAMLESKELEGQQVLLSGSGIDEQETTIEGLLTFYNDAVDSGDLTGGGKGESADKRLNNFGKMLEQAKNSILKGKIEEGLAHLRAAYVKINVFVVEGRNGGDAIDTLKGMIEFLMKDLSDK